MARVPRGPDDETDRIVSLEAEIAQLKEAIVAHAVVDQAIGVVVALGRMSPDEGWLVLRELSQHTNVKLRSVADLILIWGRGGEMPEKIRGELEYLLDRHGPLHIPGAPPLE
ncbi:ANTAR domain-containing protein [Streptomyces sp. 3214.6]|uniref:ANTAR domain-containing protein n=1 Tax=Streptomyces sp. 3214.6 TaxID=1882757 RepID=UPI00090BF48B|nr:ANTAR domain-containing protein [Streptomyces sp. 3214.6]SHH45950.1 ANTAR domain-containing protein [Streptomyces sp. 3214.6]